MKKIWFLIILLFFGISCSLFRQPLPSQVAPAEPIEPDDWPTLSWEVHTPEEEGMDSKRLLKFFDIAQEQEINLNSVVVVRDGYIVMEAYYYPFKKDVKHHLNSCTKSVTGVLMGMAIDDGFISGVETPVLDYFDYKNLINQDAWKEEMTLEHLLTMTSGIQWDEWDYSSMNNPVFIMRSQRDWAKYVLNRPMAAKPGTKYSYNSGNSVLLMNILEQETGEHSVGYAHRRLFAPLGIFDYYWITDKEMTASGDSGLMMSSRNMAKIGMLFLYGGEWDGEQLVSESWVQESTKLHFRLNQAAPAYGYHWWLMRDGYYATGHAGQNIYVLPELELVVVTTAGEPEGITWDLLTRGILPAVVSDNAIEENESGVSVLREREKKINSPPEPIPVGELPDMANTLHGHTYQVEHNLTGVRNFKLTFEDDLLFAWMDYGSEEVNWTAGLDGVYRYSYIYDFGNKSVPIAAKARWEGDKRLTIYTQPLMGSTEDVITLTFQDDGRRADVDWQWGQFRVQFEAWMIEEE
jgi:CubicO group peptidase (beta-lactamase class C family)